MSKHPPPLYELEIEGNRGRMVHAKQRHTHTHISIPKAVHEIAVLLSKGCN